MKRYLKILSALIICVGLQCDSMQALSRAEFAVGVHEKLSGNPFGSGMLNILEKIFPKMRRVAELKAAYKVDATKAVGETLKEYIENNTGKTWEKF